METSQTANMKTPEITKDLVKSNRVGLTFFDAKSSRLSQTNQSGVHVSKNLENYQNQIRYKSWS